MKKLIALLLALVMVLSMVACGANNNTTGSTEPTEPTEATQPSTPAGNADVTPTVDANTLGGQLWAAFEAAQAANSSATAEEMANILATNENIQFMCGAMPIEPGYLSGFGEFEVKGFEQGALYMPFIGSIPFVGYIFDLAEGADVAAFIADLEANCNPRWNICVCAEQTVIGSKGNRVFFLMCPETLGDGNEGGGMEGPVGGADVYYPIALEEGTFGYSFWVSFEDIMIEGVNTTAAEIANALCMAEIAPFMLGAMEVEAGLLPGFDNYEVTGFSSGAVFMPMIGSIPFVGYIFEAEAGTDMINFVNDLTANCNPAWNICVEADEVLVGYFNNMVFFLMCPASIEG